MKKIYLNWRDVEKLTEQVASSIIDSGWSPSVVIGISRGGLLPGKMLSHCLDVPMVTLDLSLRDNPDPTWNCLPYTWYPEEIANGHRLLIVDDINDSGATIAWLRREWGKDTSLFPALEAGWPWSHIKFATLLHNEASPESTDFFGDMINKEKDPCWIVFPWESWFKPN